MDRCEPDAVLDGVVSVFCAGRGMVVMMYAGYAFLVMATMSFVLSAVASSVDKTDVAWRFEARAMLCLIAGMIMIKG